MAIDDDSGQIFLMQNIMERVIKRVSADVLEIVKMYIDSNVYEAAQDVSPRKWYVDKTAKPTYEFRNAFHFGEIEKGINSLVTSLFYDWETMSVGTTNLESSDNKSGDYIHTQGGDFRRQMAEAFNVDGFVDGDFGSRKREPYWDNIIMDLFESGTLKKLFDTYIIEEFRVFGIEIMTGARMLPM